MFERTGDDPWVILYSDGDKRKSDSIKDDVAILPAEQYFAELEELLAWRENDRIRNYGGTRYERTS
jgi:hypothetical protein